MASYLVGVKIVNNEERRHPARQWQLEVVAFHFPASNAWGLNPLAGNKI